MIGMTRRRIIETASSDHAYDNPGMEWSNEVLAGIKDHPYLSAELSSGVELTREEIQYIKNAWESKQREIAQP